MPEISTIVIGAGQAGLAVSHELARCGVDHVVLERDRIGESWRRRWDSFCLVAPNWSVQLPGFAYDGDDPDGFMPKDEIVDYLERYAASFGAPVRTDTSIRSVTRANGSGFTVATNRGDWTADKLVLATGAYQKPHIPAGADSLPASVRRMDLSGYRNPDALPAGAVLIVGSGQSGCQIAEELAGAGRRVVLSCGRAPWGPRRAGGRDLFWWLAQAGFLDAAADSLPPEARLFGNVQAAGLGGGHDLNFRTLRAQGVTLVGRFVGADGATARFADDLGASVAWGDARYEQMAGVMSATAEKLGLPDLDLPAPDPFDAAAPTGIDLTPFGTVLFTGGFRPDFTSWLPWPDAFDADGFPLQTDGTSDVVDGLHFVGLHFLRKRKSALLYGVGEDAAIVADRIANA